MVLPYTRVKITDGFGHRPYLDVILVLGTRSVSTRGLLDTGADTTLVNKAFGKHLGVDFKKCRNSYATGIDGVTQKTWVAEIVLEVVNLADSVRQTEVHFIESPTVGVLLGHHGFFQNFSVKFDTYMLTFDINHIADAVAK